MDNIWDALEAEFLNWRAADLTLPFWWRDDDAVTVTPALERLTALSGDMGVDVHLAVIPNVLSSDLPSYCNKNKNLIPVAHGFAHQDHAIRPEKKCEFPDNRDILDVRVDINQGVQTLKSAFDTSFIPVFVPPWNRFAPAHLDALQQAGYKGFSTFTPRKNKWATAGIEQVNTHVDPIDWRGSRSLADPARLLAMVVQDLQDRRMGLADNSEPYGFLTHHLVHDADIWAFSETFLRRFMNGPIRLWTGREL